ncbi:MAG: DUF2148 domain-containing protein [Methanocalculaceae archaeon]|jgi:uncharacterized ferredoxin-like protein|nr:DUF2148 domain-containing protein [Methanocalculaceae archaeon]
MGSDIIEIQILGPDQLEVLATKMEEISNSAGMKFFRDTENVRESGACLLTDADEAWPTLGLNCGGCRPCNLRAEMRIAVDGAPTNTLYKGSIYALRSTDLGITVGSDVKTVSTLNIDNRIRFSAGTAAIALGFLPDSTISFAIPLFVSEKALTSIDRQFTEKYPRQKSNSY